MDKAFQYYSKAETFNLYFRREPNVEARRLYQAAIDERGDFAQAYSQLAYAQLQAWLYNWDFDSSEGLPEEAWSNANRAVQLAPNDYYANWVLADICLYRKDFRQAATLYHTVFSLAEQQAVPEEQRAIRVDHADFLLLTGDSRSAVQQAQGVISERGVVPEKWFYWVLGWAHYVDGNYQQSLDALSKLGNPRNAIRKNVITNLVALTDQGESRMAEAKGEAERFIEEEQDQGVTYADLDALLFKENKLPFNDDEKLSEWKDRLKRGFEDVSFAPRGPARR